jgi:flagellar basal body P-ring formation protein FlgA
MSNDERMTKGEQRMTTTRLFAIGTALVVLALASATRAAEIRLRAQCAVSGGVVKLSDVAELSGEDHRQAESLGSLELFPAPPAGQQRFVRVRELQDLLLLHGVNLTEHQFSGSSQVTVTLESRTAKTKSTPALPAALAKRANRRLCDAIIKYLGQRAWTVEVELTEAQARLLVDPTRTVSISGGHAPWTGTQRFEITVQPAQPTQGPAIFALDARVSPPATVVVATHSIQRGAVVRADDVELRDDAAGAAAAAVFHSLEEVVGHETTRSVAAGKPLSSEALRAPLMVHKGDVVTVYAACPGIRVRTNARARDDGSQGELVAVESMLDRSTFFARVSGIREVEVYARAPRFEQ